MSETAACCRVVKGCCFVLVLAVSPLLGRRRNKGHTRKALLTKRQQEGRTDDATTRTKTERDSEGPFNG